MNPATAVDAVELVAVAARIAGADSLAGVPQDHSRAALGPRLTDAVARIACQHGPSHRADPRRFSQLVGALAGGNCLRRAVPDVLQPDATVAKEDSLAVHP